jgi:UDP-N-acetylmuramate: L-alanyl-gamma-D-glutamyl-meso-diaminopimelate ligase
MHIHILGICGTFMAGVAALAREAGHTVTGSDAAAWPPMSTQLERLGIAVTRGYDAAVLDPAPDCVVVGNVITRGNPAIEAVLDRGLNYQSGPQWLAENVLHGRHVLAVAGTHGKTTTTSLLAYLLDQAGLEPGFLIGGVPMDFGVSARLGRAPFFVLEADEYDTAFFDKRSKFVHYHPRTAILNNLEYDHADIFPDLAAIERQFHHLVRTIPGSGRIVVNGADANLARVLEMGCWTPLERFGVDDGWNASGEGEQLHVHRAGALVGSTRLALSGAHNRLNAVAAVAAAVSVGVAPEAAVVACAGFRGVRRRLEVVGEVAGVRVYDDFAHHPTAIAATLEALRERAPARVLAVLEPRSNTMRLGVHAQELGASLRDADLSFVYVRSDLAWDPEASLGGLKGRAEAFRDLDALVEAVAGAARAGDAIVVMSNGDFGGVHGRLVARLREHLQAGSAPPPS